VSQHDDRDATPEEKTGEEQPGTDLAPDAAAMDAVEEKTDELSDDLTAGPAPEDQSSD